MGMLDIIALYFPLSSHLSWTFEDRENKELRVCSITAQCHSYTSVRHASYAQYNKQSAFLWNTMLINITCYTSKHRKAENIVIP